MKVFNVIAVCLATALGIGSWVDTASASSKGPGKATITKRPSGPPPKLPPKIRTTQSQARANAERRNRADAASRARVDAQIQRHLDEIARGKRE